MRTRHVVLSLPVVLSACLAADRDGIDLAAARLTPPPTTSGDLREVKIVADDASTDAQLGFSVAGGGDVDGDGYDDVVLGAHQEASLGSAAGAVYVVYGSRVGPDEQFKLRATDGAAEDRFGESVALLGDLDRDGFDDIAVGAWGHDEAGAAAGAVYVYGGSPSGVDRSSEVELHASDASADAWYGSSVAGGGDVDGDGTGDLAVGAPNDSGKGAAYLYSGASEAEEQILRPAELVAGDTFGSSLSISGDLNGDGYDELVVGAPTFDPGVANAGAAWVYYGGARGLDGGLRITARSPQSNDNFGKAVSIAGDIDGDSYDELLVGAHQDDDIASNSGVAHLFYGDAAGIATIGDLSYTAPDGPANAFFGVSIAPIGDQDGDGYADVVIGASGANVDGVEGGAAYLFYGGPSGIDRTRTRTVVGADTAGADRFGRSVSGAGDLDADGWPDVIVGAYAAGSSPNEAGAAYAFLAPCTDSDGDTWCNGEDCDDSVATTYPGAAWQDSATACMSDADQDGWGDAAASGDVESGSDCDDDSAYTYPGAAESESSSACMHDADGDGWGDNDPAEGVEPGTDCDDALATAYPGVARADSTTACMVDRDGDGWGDDAPPAGIEAGTDCDDSDILTAPGAAEAEGGACMRDADQDGYGDMTPDNGATPGADCDDADPDRSPETPEVCNGLDDDCDGEVDGANALDAAVPWAADADGDGWTDANASAPGCTPPEGYQAASYLADCDDSDATVSPGAAEIANDGVDQDCDGADLSYKDKGGCSALGASPGLMLALLSLLGLRRRRPA